MFVKTVLTLTVAGSAAVLPFLRGDNPLAAAAGAGNPRAFEFLAESPSALGQTRLEGLMVSDGCRCRIAVYWAEPPLERDSSASLRWADFIFERETVDFWTYGMSRPSSLRPSQGETGSVTGRRGSLESTLRLALATLPAIESPDQNGGGSALETTNFSRGSRGREVYGYKASSGVETGGGPSDTGSPAPRISGMPAHGRKYSKETRSDGTVVWRMEKTLSDEPVMTVAVKALDVASRDWSDTFNRDTLGRWTLIPEPYRAYWAPDQAYTKLAGPADVRASSRELCDEIESCRARDGTPLRVAQALDCLYLKTALLTGDVDCVRRGLDALVSRICQENSMDTYLGLLEVGQITKQVEKQYPGHVAALVRPLVAEMVGHTGGDVARSLDQIMPAIDANKWFTFGKLLLEETRKAGLMDAQAVGARAAKLEIQRLATELRPPDPAAETPSVKRYMTQLDARPPKGLIDMNGVRQILERGVARNYGENDSENCREVVERVVRLTRLIVGEGPFRADPPRLTESIRKYSELYLVTNKIKEPVDTVLATLLGLSFCDISTPEDHDALSAQFHSVGAEVQCQVNTMLAEHGLEELVTPDDVLRIFGIYDRLFHGYVDDPLWPTFKFPWTVNERTRLANMLKLRLMKLEPLMDEMSIKVKYGGLGDEPRTKMLREISLAVQQLLPQAALMRNPPYPGISCQHRGGRGGGFTAVIESGFYEEGPRAKERFRIMRYFHLGHRLEELVKAERASAMAAWKKASEQ
jgi:hypothetical protein